MVSLHPRKTVLLHRQNKGLLFSRLNNHNHHHRNLPLLDFTLSGWDTREDATSRNLSFLEINNTSFSHLHQEQISGINKQYPGIKIELSKQSVETPLRSCYTSLDRRQPLENNYLNSDSKITNAKNSSYYSAKPNKYQYRKPSSALRFWNPGVHHKQESLPRTLLRSKVIDVGQDANLDEGLAARYPTVAGTPTTNPKALINNNNSNLKLQENPGNTSLVLRKNDYTQLVKFQEQIMHRNNTLEIRRKNQPPIVSFSQFVQEEKNSKLLGEKLKRTTMPSREPRFRV